MAKEKTLEDLFHDTLKYIYYDERKILKALPKMAEKASCEKLKQAFEDHLAETEQQVERVEQAFAETGKAARAKTCEAMKGLIEEAEEVMKEDAEPSVMDAVLIGCAQKVEHYEIATYGTLCSWARALGYDNALRLLKQNIDEEEAADKKLSMLSESINQDALASNR